MNRILFLSALLFSVAGHSQALPPNESPLPQLKGVKRVIIRNIQLESPLYSTVSGSDTSAVYLIGSDGWPHTEYSYASGIRNSKRVYVYAGNNLTQKMTFENKKQADLFRALEEDSMVMKSRMELEYKDGRLAAKHYYCCKDTPGLTEALFFTYDKQGRLSSKATRRYTIPGGLYWGSQKNDSLRYCYSSDSVYVTRFEGDSADSPSRFYQKMDDKIRLLAYRDQTADGRHFEGVSNTYDAKGRLLESRYQSDRPAIQPDGIVLRAEKVVYHYDEKGRLKEEIYAAGGKDRWKSLYFYVE